MRVFTLIVCLPGILAAQDPREIVRRSVEIDRKNAETARSYTYLERHEDRELDASGNVKKTGIQTWDVTLLEGSPYRRLVARNGQPLSPKERQREEDKLRRSIVERRKETAEERARRIADWERRQQRQREPLKELPEAFDFRLIGTESLAGGEVYTIDATPKPGYRPNLPSAAYFPKVKARLWIDKKDYRWARVEVETMDTISFAGFLVRLAKGSRLTIEQEHVNQEVWLLKRVTIRASARLALVKNLHEELIITFSDYKKFQVDSRVVSTSP